MPPTYGCPGLDVAVNVQYSADGSLLVEPVKNSPACGQSWAVSPDQDLLLDCHGGNGGHGGFGENGQPGGQGEKGMDATKYSNATVGTSKDFARALLI